MVWPWLPSPDTWLWLACLIVVSGRRRALACFLLGLMWAICFSHWQLSWLQYPTLFTRSQIIVAQVDALHSTRPHHSQLIVRLSHLNGQALSPKPKVLLNWQSQQPSPKNGQVIQSVARLRLPHGLHNPGTFASSRWLLGQGVTAQASISGVLSASAPAPNEGVRARAVKALREHTQHLAAQPWILALTVGDRSGLTRGDWELLRGLGISHLFAISGLHIGLVAALGLLVGRLTGRRWLAGLLAVALALIYAWLAGFSVPTQRALLMLVLWLGIWLWGRFWSGWRILLATCTLLLSVQPWLVLNQGFWLSVVAVSAILALAAWQKTRSLWRLQLGLSLLLLPLVMLIFGGLSWLSLPVNWLLIPLFSVLLMPLLLMAALLLAPAPLLSHALFWLVDFLLHHLMSLLQALHTLASPWLWLTEAQLGLILALLLLPFLLLPRARSISILGITVALLAQWPAPHWQVRVLDVGQGLSVLVTQGKQALLYDTGNRFSSGFNMADAVILPLLRRLGVSELEYMVISHNDQDHSGNRDYLAKVLPIKHRLGEWHLGQKCRAGQHMQWGRLSLTILWPVQLTGHSNNDSCVMRISDGQLSVLLTGDIEARAEYALLATQPLLSSQLLISPHHGSNSSSTSAFIQAVSPRWGVHTAGFNNRWGFPGAAVKERYAQQNIEQLVTGELGMVHFISQDEQWHLMTHRRSAVWYHQLNAWLQHTKPLE
ncbi:DNA internalization-related competence protein ComEC/Rec2 [Oceanisphaera avium]|nr:DNA internalization-related competence protein ComEC/Rec2 [Oceanisphaera avium]